jgi:hypothetical protein
VASGKLPWHYLLALVGFQGLTHHGQDVRT